MPGDSIQHDLEVTCPKCLQPYKDHKGDEAEIVCPPPPPRAMVTGGALLRMEVSRDDAAWLQTYYDGLALLDHVQARHRRFIEDFFG